MEKILNRDSKTGRVLKTHGMLKTPEYKAWGSMKQRCFNPKCKEYKNYGGRGITMSDRWINSFENFLQDMGQRPSKDHSIERIEVNGNYETYNCKWATLIEQHNNRRDNVFLEYKGERLTVAQLSRQEGVNYDVLLSRINRGWDVEKAIITPVKQFNITPKKITKILPKYEYRKELLTINQIADKYQLSYITIVKWIKKGMVITEIIDT